MSIHNLFVYGTLRPGETNAYILERIGGTFQKGYILGHHDRDGWGKTGGYPAIKCDHNGERIEGELFTSERLEAHLPFIDEFEGEAYTRVRVSVILESGETMRAYIYQLTEE